MKVKIVIDVPVEERVKPIIGEVYEVKQIKGKRIKYCITSEGKSKAVCLLRHEFEIVD